LRWSKIQNLKGIPGSRVRYIPRRQNYWKRFDGWRRRSTKRTTKNIRERLWNVPKERVTQHGSKSTKPEATMDKEFSVALTTNDWVEIVAALNSKIVAIERGDYVPEFQTGDDNAWITHLEGIIEKINQQTP
jgi:hypothetical protein